MSLSLSVVKLRSLAVFSTIPAVPHKAVAEELLLLSSGRVAPRSAWPDFYGSTIAVSLAGLFAPDRMPDRMPEYMPNRMPDRMTEYMPNRMPDRMTEYMSDRMLDRMLDRMPEIECRIGWQIECQIECQKECQIRMLDGIVTVFAMVMITRRQVIFLRTNAHFRLGAALYPCIKLSVCT